MKHLSLKLAVLGTLGLVSAQALATGLVAIPATGFSGTAYTSCNTTGNFGSGTGPTGSYSPTATANNACAVFPANDATSPVAGFILIASANRMAIMNNTYTNNTNVQVGTVTDRVWRNAAATECIYGTKFVPGNVDYWITSPGSQYFEVNDIARGGFNASGSVNAGYFNSSSAHPIYRIGRSFTSVQHRPTGSGYPNNAIAGSNYLALPGLGSDASINGEIVSTYATTPQKQTANINSNWIDFTTEIAWNDGNSSAVTLFSSMMYVQAACTSAAPITVENAIRLRQTGQEMEPLIEISVSGYVPPGGTAAPAPVVPY